MPNPPPFLLLGQVLRPQGVRGELRVRVLTDYPERIVPGSMLYAGLDPAKPARARRHVVESVRTHQGYLLLKFTDVPDRDAADLLREQYIMVPLADAVPLDEGEFYLYQAIGLAVYTDEGEHLGDVQEIIETGANDVFVVRGERGEILLPAIDEVIREIDVDAGRMTVHLMEGLRDE